MAVDESLDAAKSICNANPNAMLFILFPQQHTSVEKTAIYKNKRSSEDKVFASLG